MGTVWGAPSPPIAQVGALWGAPCPLQPLRSPTPYFGTPPGPPTPRGADRCSLGCPVPPSPTIPGFFPFPRACTEGEAEGKAGGKGWDPTNRGGRLPRVCVSPVSPARVPRVPPVPGRGDGIGTFPNAPANGVSAWPALIARPLSRIPSASPRRCHLRVPKHAGGSAGGVPAPPTPRPLQYTLGPSGPGSSPVPGGMGRQWGHPGGLHPQGQRGGDGRWEWGSLGVSRDVQTPPSLDLPSPTRKNSPHSRPLRASVSPGVQCQPEG